tara:strand:+ start:512 stop:826 length:315 start_codon:yes stop_codon:yes gene_type:complete
MATLSNKIKQYVNSEVNFTSDVILQDDGNGVYIKEWNLDIAKPTDAQLSAVESDADKMERNNKVIAIRKNLYGSLEQQIENIIENGLQAEIDRVNQIKTDNPKE